MTQTYPNRVFFAARFTKQKNTLVSKKKKKAAHNEHSSHEVGPKTRSRVPERPRAFSGFLPLIFDFVTFTYLYSIFS